MKKVILSSIIGALFGGAVVLATVQTPVSQQNQIVANAKGLPETPENKVTVIENKSTDNLDEQVCNPNEVLEKNKKFYQVYDSEYNEYTIFNIKKRTVSELEFELTYKNEKLNAPFVLKGTAKGVSCLGKYYPDGEPYVFIDKNQDEHTEDGFSTDYYYENNDCYLAIKRDENILTAVNGNKCKKLKEVGFKNFYIAINKYE